MQNFSLMRNKLIEDIDARSEVRQIGKPLKNKLKTIVRAYSNNNIGSNTVYGRQFTFDIPRQYDNLAQLYIKCTLSTGSVASTVETYFASKIFKQLVIRTRTSKTELQRISPQYTSSRLDEVYNSPLFSHLNNSIEPDGTFLAGDVVVFVPIFGFFSERVETFLRTRHLEPLELECITNDNYASMGMSASLTSGVYELYCLYFDSNDSGKDTDLPLYKSIYPWSKLEGSYNIFYEDPITCASGTTEKNVLIRCPHPAFAIHCALVDSSTNRTQINTFELTVGGNDIAVLDYRMNYNFFNNHNGFVENGTFSYFINQDNVRSNDSGLIVFNGSMSPAYIKVTFDSLAEDYTLYIFEEYRTNFVVNSKGFITPSTDFNLPDGYDGYKSLQYPNSSTGPFTLQQ